MLREAKTTTITCNKNNEFIMFVCLWQTMQPPSIATCHYNFHLCISISPAGYGQDSHCSSESQNDVLRDVGKYYLVRTRRVGWGWVLSDRSLFSTYAVNIGRERRTVRVVEREQIHLGERRMQQVRKEARMRGKGSALINNAIIRLCDNKHDGRGQVLKPSTLRSRSADSGGYPSGGQTRTPGVWIVPFTDSPQRRGRAIAARAAVWR